MTERSYSGICSLLCCPPLPSKIAAKLAFMPPPPSYELKPNPNGDDTVSLAFTDIYQPQLLNYIPDNVEATFAQTRRGNKIAVLYMRARPESKLTFLVSHGNAVDLGLMLNFMGELCARLNVNILSYDYSGYGASFGKALEKNLYADAECAFDVLRTKFCKSTNQIVLYGQSIGTVPTVHLATLHEVAAVVLHSPLMSGLRVAFPRLKRNYWCDVFTNHIRAPQIRSPTLVIHGMHDEIIDPLHAKTLYDLIPITLEPLYIEEAGHNNCEIFEEYLIRLEYMIHVELPEDVRPVYLPQAQQQQRLFMNNIAAAMSSSPTSPRSPEALPDHDGPSTSNMLQPSNRRRATHGSYRYSGPKSWKNRRCRSEQVIQTAVENDDS